MIYTCASVKLVYNRTERNRRRNDLDTKNALDSSSKSCKSAFRRTRLPSDKTNKDESYVK